MKKTAIILLGLLILSCNKDGTEPTENNSEFVSNLKYILKEKNEPNNLIYTQEYSLDEQGEVISEKYTNINNPQYSSLSVFEYDENGKVIEEIRDGQPFRKVKWTNNVAEIFNNQEQKIAEFTFDDNGLIEYKTELNSNNVRIRKLNYDSNQNIISIKNETEIYVEFLDYDTNKKNPLNIIKSIGILRIDYKPFFKNIFRIEKAYPYEADDYSFYLTFYDYHYTFDSENRVFQIEDEKTLIHTQEFLYE